MVTTKNSSVAGIGSAAEYYGLSTDAKPTEIANGSVFFEMDTSKVYLYDAENAEWREI